MCSERKIAGLLQRVLALIAVGLAGCAGSLRHELARTGIPAREVDAISQALPASDGPWRLITLEWKLTGVVVIDRCLSNDELTCSLVGFHYGQACIDGLHPLTPSLPSEVLYRARGPEVLRYFARLCERSATFAQCATYQCPFLRSGEGFRIPSETDVDVIVCGTRSGVLLGIPGLGASHFIERALDWAPLLSVGETPSDAEKAVYAFRNQGSIRMSDIILVTIRAFDSTCVVRHRWEKAGVDGRSNGRGEHD